MTALGIPTELLSQGGAWALVTTTVVMILTGRLVPRPFYRALEQERDHWRSAAERNAEHTGTLLPLASITTEVTRALAGQTTGDHADERTRP